MNVYELAVDEALIVRHLGATSPDDDYEKAKRNLQELIMWEVYVATDPLVNGGYRLTRVDRSDE
jgi:ABC-type oligopeptide transport system substrate-binding subunit